ncbi:MAG TPA: ribosome maturation factor RimP [Thermotogota bacterium]|nr:ribosome maturation factor RimP [Thermotogota bacterium]HPJ88933.1 ribosome maturation factor RimP [Thermotogota bacterium]HPR95313.1 ribosome maturation factor RimP [Thermotogota bacterium]
MKKKMGIVEEIAKEALKELGLELYDVSYSATRNNKTLKVYIDHLERAITVQDCEDASRIIGPRIDELDLIEGSYFLEVSSPGVERELRNPKDYERFCGSSVKIITKLPVEKRTVFIGKLVRYNRVLDDVKICVLERDSEREFEIDYKNVKKAQLYLEV